MKTLTAILLLLAAAAAYGQTVKTLGYNTTNGEVVYTGTNVLTFTNGLGFSTNAAATTRTNLDIGLPALTNTSNVTMMRALSGSTDTNVPFSGIIIFPDANGDLLTITISNGIIQNYTIVGP